MIEPESPRARAAPDDAGAPEAGPAIDPDRTVEIPRPDDDTRVSGSGSGFGAARPLDSDEQPRIAGYELLDEAHRGGQGVVYRATQLSTKRTVALKVLLEGPFAGDVARRRFEREIELAASLRHPNIVTILESGVSQGRYYFAMEYIDGRALDVYVAERKPGLRESLELIERICLAVNFAHLRGVIHRDLKPSNILVDAEGNPQVLDFGLAKSRNAADPHRTHTRALSTPGQVMGTLAYMSPEQAAGSQDVDVRTDVYSLGVIAYEALLGRPPYAVTGSLAEILSRIANDDPAPPRSVRSSSRLGKLIDDELGTILLKALEKDPARRYQTAGELAVDIRRYLRGEPIEAKRASGFYVLKKTLRRYRIQAAAAGLILLMLIVFAVVLAVLYRSERYSRAEADELRGVATERARIAQEAAEAAEQASLRERAAREEAEQNARQAMIAAEQRREALVRLKIQRGDAASLRGDLADARDSYWEAYAENPESPAARWSLRQYYVRSGDRGATQLYLHQYGPVMLSRDGAYVAVCETPYSLTVRRSAGGEPLGWIPVPEPPLAIDVLDDGRVALVGGSWGLVWSVADDAVLGQFEWSARERPLSCHLTADGAFVLIVSEQDVRSVRVADGRQADSHELGAALRGAAEYSIAAGLLAAPTSAGVELVSMTDDGALSSELFWKTTPDNPPRAVRFISEELLAVLSDRLQIALISGGQRGQWMSFIDQTRDWDMFDLKRGVGRVALGARDGRIRVYRGNVLLDERRLTESGIEHLRLADDARTVVTLDRRGSITRWDPTLRDERRQRIHDSSPAHWTVSEDGGTLLMVDSGGQVLRYEHSAGGQAREIRLPRLLDMVTGRDPRPMRVALSGDGEIGVIHYDGQLWFQIGAQSRATPARWRDQAAPYVREIAMSADGGLLAVYAESDRADVQRIYLLSVEPAGRGGRRTVRPLREVVDVRGAAVRWMCFLPGTRMLLVARSNGAIVVHSVEEASAERETGRPVLRRLAEPLFYLDAPVHLAAIDRAGHVLAAACDDGILHLTSLIDASELARITLGRDAGALSFNAAGDVLMVRDVRGELNLYPMEVAEPIAIGPFSGAGRTFAAWIGDKDAMVYDDDGGLYEVRYQDTDELIRENESYGRARLAARAVAEGDYARAWRETVRMERADPAVAREAQLLLVEDLLRRPHAVVRPEWVDQVVSGASSITLLRLGHAAYHGGRFEQARDWLATSAERLGAMDAYTAWRIAECEYLLGDKSAAADALGRLLDRPDLPQAERWRVEMQHLAALRLSGRAAEARSLLERLQSRLAGQRLWTAAAPGEWSGRSDVISLLATLTVGSYLVDGTREAQLGETIERLLIVFREPWLMYRDDIEFFIAELARVNGDLATARIRYQNCIDLARDAWPSDWAALRLRQLGQGRGFQNEPQAPHAPGAGP